MAKVTVTELENLESQTTAVQAINANDAALAAAIENTLSRDGTTPNSMSANLDMDSNRILNLPEPVNNTEPLRLGDVGGVLPADIAGAGASAAAAAASAAAAAASATEAAGYVGAATSAPKWTTARTITLSGDISGVSPTWDGSTDLVWTGLQIGADTVTDVELATGAALANLGYTPANLVGATFTGDVRLNFTATSLSTDSAGFRGLPIRAIDVNYSFVIDDVGRCVRHANGTGHAWTIEPVATTAYPVGAAIVVRNVGTGVITLTRGAGVALRKSGSATDANVSLAQWGFATLVHEDTNTWIVTGTGIT